MGSAFLLIALDGIAWVLFRRLPQHYNPSSNVGILLGGAPACSRQHSKAE